MANKIRPISKSKVVDYSNEQLQNFWQSKEDKTYSVDQDYKQNVLNALESVYEGIVCIQSEKLTDKHIIKQIFDTARGREVKIYILVNQYTEELDLLNEVCLIRYDLNNTGSFILSNPNSKNPKGWFFSGEFTEQALTAPQQLFQELEEKDGTELFRHFCYHFWETATKEIIENRKHTSVTSKPIDVFHDTKTYGDKDFVYSTLFDFVENTTRRKLSEKLIVPLKKEKQTPILISSTLKVDLGNVILHELLSKNDFENYTPTLVDHETACEVEYAWVNIPFYLPEKSNKSPLYEKWKKETERITKHLDSILEKIVLAEKKEKTISRTLSRFFLGKKTMFNKLKADIEELRQVDFANITDRELKENINDLDKIYSKVESEIGEIEQEDRKAKLDEEISNLKLQELERNNILTEKIEELDQKQKTASVQLKAFLEKHSIEENLLGKVRNEWQQKSGNKNKKHNPTEAKEAESKLSDLNEIQNQLFINKIKLDIEKIEKEIKRIEDDVKRKENEKSKPYLQTDTKSSLNEFVGNQSPKPSSTSSKTFTVPDLPQLPNVGKLFQLNSLSYLAIEFWEDYDRGKIEAARLKADLCTFKI
ncbi:MAG: hypothetical protein R3D00_23225 [Bacteroidia bacterium]